MDCGNPECGHHESQHVKSGPSKGRCLASDRLGFSICRCGRFEIVERDEDLTDDEGA
jgi:hypothetical protein